MSQSNAGACPQYHHQILLFSVVNHLTKTMTEQENADELLDYDEEENEATVEGACDVQQVKKDVKGTYVSIHSSGFRDFLLKPELLRSIVDKGFEHPSEG